MKTKIAMIFTALSLGLVSCKKDAATLDNSKQEVVNINDVRASQNFNWSTQKSITFKVEGFKALATEKNVLKVTSVDGKDVFFAGNYSMADDLTQELNIPRLNTQVRVSFGSINKIVSIEKNTINFSYISNDSQEN